MAQSDFGRKHVKPAGNENLADPRKSGTPSTGFNEAPQTPQDRGGPGQGLPPNGKKIR